MSSIYMTYQMSSIYMTYPIYDMYQIYQTRIWMTCVTLHMYQSRLVSVTYISAEVAPPPTPIFYSYIYMTSVTFMSSLSLCLTECVSHLCDRRASLLLLKYEGDTCYMCCSVLQCVAVCCSVLQCVAVCCSVLQ